MRNRTGEIILLVLACVLIVPLWADFQQQQAKVIQANPKYIKLISIFTTRRSRSSPYSTDLNLTTIGAWGNNVTIKLSYYKLRGKSDALALEFKTCDMIKLTWVRDWVKKFSNMPINPCPLKYGVYRFNEFELPPKNFPLLSLMDKNSDYEGTFLAYGTKTKEPILEISISLKFNTRPKFKRNKS